MYEMFPEVISSIAYRYCLPFKL